MRRSLAAVLLLLAAAVAAEEINRDEVADPRRVSLPDGRSRQAWESLFNSNPIWVTREVAVLATLHPERLPTLWTARLLYRGEPWTLRLSEPYSNRRWKAADREVKLAILRDARWRRDPAMLPGIAAYLGIEDGDAALVVSALSALWLGSQRDGQAAAVRISDPRRADRLPGAGLPGARQYALQVLIGTVGPSDADARGPLEWALLSAEGGERLAALSSLPAGAVPDLISRCLERLAQQLAAGRLDDDGTAAAVLACSRLGETVGESAARTLAELVASAPREVACAAAAALARSVTWKNAIDPEPLLARLGRERDPAVRHGIFAVLLRLAPERIDTVAGAAGWAALARHRKALQDWAWRQYQQSP